MQTIAKLLERDPQCAGADRIQRVNASDADLLRYREERGLVPGAQIEVREYSPFDHNITVKVGRKSFVLGLSITGKVFVEEN